MDSEVYCMDIPKDNSWFFNIVLGKSKEAIIYLEELAKTEQYACRYLKGSLNTFIKISIRQILKIIEPIFQLNVLILRIILRSIWLWLYWMIRLRSMDCLNWLDLMHHHVLIFVHFYLKVLNKGQSPCHMN